MALEKPIVLDSGIAVATCYWRVCVITLDFPQRTMTVEIRGFRDQAAYAAGFRAVAARGYVFTDAPYTNEDGDDVPDVRPWLTDLSTLQANIYTWLKTTVFFAGATDV